MDSSGKSTFGCGANRNIRLIPLGIKTICQLTLLQLLLASNVQWATADFYNQDYAIGHDSDEMGTLRMPTEFAGENGFSEIGEDLEKRHLGSVAALSGMKDKTQHQLLTPQLFKRHLGSLASASGLKPRNLVLPQLLQKRYLGSSSFRPRSQSDVGGSDMELLEKDKRHLGALAKINTKPFNPLGFSGYGTRTSAKEGSKDQFYEYPLEKEDMEKSMETNNFYGFQDEPVAVKSKRFLGTLARGGWFPRQFRGIVAENAFDKRHIGSAARMGWLPESRSDRDEGFGEEGGFKRNIQSVKNIQFAVPVANSWGWGRPREKRMVQF